MASLPPSAARVQEALSRLGHDHPVVTFPDSTRTSAEAAAAIGCTVGQIAKSLVFRAEPDNRPVLVIASGTNRVDEDRVVAALADILAGGRIVRASADFVRTSTGFAIGGVPPIGHAAPALVVIDTDLLDYDRIWAAAGTPNAVFELTPHHVVAMTGGKVAAIAASPPG